MIKKREFLQLSKTFNPIRNKIGGWYLSEKLDGTRCLWDGGISRGHMTQNIPWASISNPKTGVLKTKIKPVATGLWSRYGNPIIVPDEFLDKLPPFPCDGELWAGRGNFQLCRSICAGDSPDPRFMDQIEFAVFSSPPLEHLFRSGTIKNPIMWVVIDYPHIQQWIDKNPHKILATPQNSTFEQELFAMRAWEGWSDQVYLLRQTILPTDDLEANAALSKYMDQFLSDGGEGVIIRDPNARWLPKRVGTTLKFKSWDDSEGEIIGFISGRLTDKGSKHLGKIGALILWYQEKRLELSGFTDEEREFSTNEESKYATKNPGVDMPSSFEGKYFKFGQRVTFKHRGLSDDGIPKEARYWRTRGEE